MTDEELDKLYLMYRRGHSDQEIADALNYSRSHVGNTRRELGYAHKRKGRPYKFGNMVIASMMEMRRQGMNCAQIARRMRINRVTVYNYVCREERVKQL